MALLRHLYRTAAIAWLLALPAGAFLAAREHASVLVHAAAFGLYSIGSLICHQRPERSFHLWSAQLPVCARCTGIYLGAVVGLVRRPQGGPRSAPEARWLLLAAAVPTLATLVYEWTTGVAPSNWTRWAAGLPLGAVVSWLVLRVN